MKDQFIKQLYSFFTKTFLCTTLLFSMALQAKETNTSDKQSKSKQYYIVEVILFKHINTQGKNKENWSNSELMNHDNSSSYALAEYDLNNQHFLPIAGATALSPEYYQLLDSANHIRYSKDFQLLAHFGWTQASLSKQSALPVLISANPFSDDLLPNGDLTLYVSRFLHLKVNLMAAECSYENLPMVPAGTDEAMPSQADQVKTISNTEQPEPVQASPGECVNRTYHFSQNRKMRSKELHYIDNPVFGLLVYVTPFKKGND
ncbi:MAG: hypothetical protein KAI17_25850 [Thiotrichaceae bacterium]|nr:hypothetical protein [Thiotrichaceae bacterium]